MVEVDFIANRYVLCGRGSFYSKHHMWIVCAVCSGGDSRSISLQVVDLFQVHQILKERARLDGAACTLSQAFYRTL